MVGDIDNNPEIGKSVLVNGISTNYHDLGSGRPAVFLHGSGPGVSAWTNWRPNLPTVSSRLRALAPDLVGFGYTDRPYGIEYSVDTWVSHLLGFLDALELPCASLVGNSFGGALALALASRYPDRVDKIVLMGSVGLSFPITDALDLTWGYQPSIANMRRLLDVFAYDRTLVSDELAEIRYRASIRPGVQESYAAMFPPPRQHCLDSLATAPEAIRSLPHEALIVHGREDRVIPMSCALRIFELIPKAQLHIFGQCGHWTQIEHSERFNDMLAKFLAPAEVGDVI